MARRDIGQLLSFVEEAMSVLLGRNLMKCQNERERFNCRKEGKFDKLSLNLKHNKISRGASKKWKFA